MTRSKRKKRAPARRQTKRKSQTKESGVDQKAKSDLEEMRKNWQEDFESGNAGGINRESSDGQVLGGLG